MAFSLSSGSLWAQNPTYLGFDRNTYPGDANLKALRQTFTYTGYWLNNPPGEKTNTWTGHRAAVESAGFGFLVLFNGRLNPDLKSVANATKLAQSDAHSPPPPPPPPPFPSLPTLSLTPNHNRDGYCQPQGISVSQGLHVDMNTAPSSDPSHGRTRGPWGAGTPAREMPAANWAIDRTEFRRARQEAAWDPRAKPALSGAE